MLFFQPARAGGTCFQAAYDRWSVGVCVLSVFRPAHRGPRPAQAGCPRPLCPVTPGRPDFFTAVYARGGPHPGRTGGHLWSGGLSGRPAPGPAVSWAAPWPGRRRAALSSSPVPGWGPQPRGRVRRNGHPAPAAGRRGRPLLPDGRVDLSRCLWDGGEERSTL